VRYELIFILFRINLVFMMALVIQVGGVSRIGTIKYGLESRGTKTRAGLCWQGPAATVNYRPVLSPERELQNKNPQLSKENFK
jgi:hypothetical protein